MILYHLISDGISNFEKLNKELVSKFAYKIDTETFDSALNNIELKFITENHKKKLKSVKEIYGLNILNKNGNDISPGKSLNVALNNSVFKKYLLDNVLYGIKSYTKIYKKEDFLVNNQNFLKICYVH